MSFCHLHVHTQYSLLDGINRADQLCKHVHTNSMTACAISDHGNMFGHIDFYKEAKKAGIKPLLGMEAYITNDEDYIEENKNKFKDNWHCILIAMNNQGYEDLIWLNNQASLHNFYYKPRISLKNLQQRSANLIATSSCLGGVVCKLGKFDSGNKTFDDVDGKAERNLGIFRELFGDRFYAEIQDDRARWEQSAYNEWLIKKAKAYKTPMVITADAHFLNAGEKRTHDIVMAQQLKVTVQEYKSDEDGLAYGDKHYIRAPDDMKQAAISYGVEEAYWNTGLIADKCNVELTLGKYKSPLFPIQNELDYKNFLQWKASKFECLPGV